MPPSTMACTDVTDLAGAGLDDMDDMVGGGVSSFKLLWATQHTDGGRQHHFQGPVTDRQERRAGLHARRKRQRD